MIKKIFKPYIINITSSIIFFLLLILFYKIFLIRPYYEQLVDEFSFLRLFFAFSLLVLFSVFFFSKMIGEFEKKILSIFITLLLIPSLCLFVFQNNSIFFLILTFLSLLIVIFLTTFTDLSFLLKLKKIQFSQNSVFWNLLIINLLFFIFSLITLNLNLITLDIDSFSDNRELLMHKPLRVYLNSIITTTFLPACFAFALNLRKFFIAFLIFFLFLFYGIILSVKILILMPFGILLFFLLHNNRGFNAYIFLLASLSVVFFIIEILLKIYDGGAIPQTLYANYIGRRLILIPSFINYIYLIEFESGIYSYWSQSKLTLNLVDKVYPLEISKYIGLKYFGPQFNVNVGWIGAGYSNMGFFGVLIYSAIIGMYLSILKTFSKKLSGRFVSTLSFVSIMYFLSSDVIAIFSTYGVFFLVLILLVTKRDE